MILPRRARGSAPGYETSAPDRPGDAPEAGGKERTERGRWADEGAGSDPVAGARDARWEAERRRTMEALEKHAWNITRAARELGLARQYLHRRIRDMGLKRPR